MNTSKFNSWCPVTKIAASVVVISVWSNTSFAGGGEISNETTAAPVSEHVVALDHSAEHDQKDQVVTANNQVENSTDTQADIAALTMTVYKSPTCGCCSAWVDYMKEEGFTVNSINTDEMNSVKLKFGLTDPRLYSCHTAIIDDYVIEGHVPANDVKRLISEQPDILGLTAPGMPLMSPGMASREPQDYDVYSVDADNRAQLWSEY